MYFTFLQTVLYLFSLRWFKLTLQLWTCCQLKAGTQCFLWLVLWKFTSTCIKYVEATWFIIMWNSLMCRINSGLGVYHFTFWCFSAVENYIFAGSKITFKELLLYLCLDSFPKVKRWWTDADSWVWRCFSRECLNNIQ